MSDSTLVILIVTSMIILMILALTVLWFFFYFQNKIIHFKMKEKEIEIEYQKKLLLNTVKTQENERARISAELHDDIGSTLNVLNLNLHLLKRKISQDSETLKIFVQIEDLLVKSISQTRIISHNLMPQMLRKFGFQHALHELADSVNLNGSVHISVRNEHLCNLKNDLNQLHLLRIIQELINNTLKHSEASEIEIHFTYSEMDQLMTMSYTDNGAGFDYKAEYPGLGIYNIKTRAELLNGCVEYSDLNDKSRTCFILKFPSDG